MRITSYLDMGFNPFGQNLITNRPFSSANLNDAFFETPEASIRTSKMRDLSVTNAKVQNISADKITAGTLTAVTKVGDDSIELDGENHVIRIYDNLGNVSVYIAGGAA